MTPARSITCPACGGAIGIKAAGYTVSVACQYCGSILDVAHPEVSVIAEYHRAAAQLELPIGSRGVLAGTEWEVIGYLERADDEMAWEEYLLFNPYGGYRWLVKADGEWSLGTMVPDVPGKGWGNAVTWRGGRFTCDYDPVPTWTKYVLGEFYWRVREGDTVRAATFEGNDDVSLSCETSDSETNWTLVESLPHDLVEAAFVPPGAAPSITGETEVKPLNPGGFGRKGLVAGAAAPAFQSRAEQDDISDSVSSWPEWLRVTALAVVTFFACFIVMAVFGWEGDKLTKDITVAPGGAAQAVSLGTITISRPFSPVTITATASDNLSNQWVDLDYSLVDTKTQQSIDGYATLEFYRGTDSDGDWTEGSRSATAKIAGVPAGTYEVLVEAQAQNWGSGSSSLSGVTISGWSGNATAGGIALRIQAAAGGVFFSNLLMVFLGLIAPPLFLLWLAMRGGSDDYDDDD